MPPRIPRPGGGRGREGREIVCSFLPYAVSIEAGWRRQEEVPPIHPIQGMQVAGDEVQVPLRWQVSQCHTTTVTEPPPPPPTCLLPSGVGVGEGSERREEEGVVWWGRGRNIYITLVRAGERIFPLTDIYLSCLPHSQPGRVVSRGSRV